MKINVQSGISAISNTTFESAVNKSRATIENYNEITGKAISEVYYSPDLLIIRFDKTEYNICLSIGENKIICNISERTVTNARATDTVIPDSLTLEFNKFSVEWDKKRFFDNFIGKSMRVSLSDQYIFVYVDGMADYMCDYLIDKDGKYPPFLYLSEF